MPTWVLLVALLLLPPIVLVVCEYAGVDPSGAAAFAVSLTVGPGTVLACRALDEWTAVPAVHLAAWAEWALLVAAPIAATAMLIWALRRSVREDGAGSPPDSWCALRYGVVRRPRRPLPLDTGRLPVPTATTADRWTPTPAR